MDTMICIWLGAALGVLGGIAAPVLYIRANPEKWLKWRARGAGFEVTTPVAERTDVMATDKAMAADKPLAEILPLLEPGQTVTLSGIGERAVQAVGLLTEMTQEGDGPWIPRGQESYVIRLAGDVWLLQIPRGEGQAPVWIKGAPVDTAPLGTFYRSGSDGDGEGPATKFYLSEQRKPIRYRLPNELTPGVVWNVVDIGAVKVRLVGKSRFGPSLKDGDLFMFVTSKESGTGKEWLFYFDPDPPAQSRGLGVLIRGEQFDPEVMIGGIL